jgi:small subunit ribosomal protein S20
MAQIKSQIKRIKTNEKARVHNAALKSQFRTAVKKVRVAVASKDSQKAELLLRAAVRLLDKSVSKGVQHRNTAARQKSQLQKLVNGLAVAA